MKLSNHCYGCLKGLAEKVVALSRGNIDVLNRAITILENMWDRGHTPPAIANRLLRFVRQATGVYDPYVDLKTKEVEEATKAIRAFRPFFPETLEGLLKFSALGNAVDFFCHDGYTVADFDFVGHIDKIEKEIYTKGDDVTIFGDNCGEFLFDLELMRFLEKMEKKVFYVVKEHPAQNDLSMADVKRFGYAKLFSNIISTGTGEVGIRKEALVGKLAELWQGNGVVIAKGMGNYETMSEFNNIRPVIHVMKVKCSTVAESVGRKVGQYIAMIGGEGHGKEERLL